MRIRNDAALLQRLGLISLGMAILATLMSVIRARYMPHYAGEVNTPNAGFNTWYWHLIDSGSILLWLTGLIVGAVSWRSRSAKWAFAVSFVHVVFFLYDVQNWLPDF